ncbi:MAG: cation-transporting P-type ATPase [Minisyncoccia bacterium]
MSNTFHDVPVSEIGARFNIDLLQGVPDAELGLRAKQFGKNILPNALGFSFLRSVFRACKEPLALVLFGALLVTFFLGAYVDCAVIAFVVFINVSVSVYQERQSSKIFETLQGTVHHMTVVLRDGVEKNIQAEDVVVGDIVLLTGGVRVPADGRLIEVNELAINESALTGEWKPQAKTTASLRSDVGAQDMTNMAWGSSYISSGYGKMLVTSVGTATRFGSIASSVLSSFEDETPLQKNLQSLSYHIVYFILAVAVLIIATGTLRGEDLYTMLLVALAVSIAAMPEGLPAVMTVVLSSAMQSVHASGGLIKRLYSAETFGSVSTILTDKTGTLTTGEMHFSGVSTGIGPEKKDALSALGIEILSTAVRASDAFIEVDEHGALQVHGRPIEIAIVRAGLDHGIDKRALKELGHEQKELVQFEPTRRFAITLNEHPEDGARMYLTGSPEHILAVCSKYATASGVEPVTDAVTNHFLIEEKLAAAEGKRFIAVAYRASTERFISEDVKVPQHGERLGFVFLGLVFFSDTLRDGVRELVQTAEKAHIQICIATGDHPGTALYIAEQIGLTGPEYKNVLLGEAVEKMTDNELHEALKTHKIFARVLPEHKLRIVHLLQESGEIVAMTGDGINDAPALTAANIGVSLSSATDIAKEASDMVLLQDNFKVIIDAIQEGRRALQNIRTVLVYLLSVSLGEVVLITGSLISGLALPLVPVQILWANIVQEGFMSFPFALNPARKDSMIGREPAITNILTPQLMKLVSITSVGTGVLLLLLYVFLSFMLTDQAEIKTIIFMSLSLSAILSAFCFRDIQETVLTNMTNLNRTIIVSFGFSIILFAGVFAIPWLREVLSLVPIRYEYVVIAFSFALARVLFVESSKLACGTLHHQV